MERKVGVNRRGMYEICTRHATVMTKWNARQRAILHWISSIRTFKRHVMLLWRLWWNQQRGRLSSRSTKGAYTSIRPMISEKYESTPLRRLYFPRMTQGSTRNWYVVTVKKKKIYTSFALHQQPKPSSISRHARAKRQTTMRQFTCYHHAPIKDNADLTPYQTSHWQTFIIYVHYFQINLILFWTNIHIHFNNVYVSWMVLNILMVLNNLKKSIINYLISYSLLSS